MNNSHKSLAEIWIELDEKGFGTDKFSVHSYGSVYEELLAPYRHTAKNILEIGLFNGASLRLWEGYFTNATVHGIDCDEQPHGGMADLRPMIASGKHNIHIFDATNAEEVANRFKGVKFEIIWEDAGHHTSQQVELYNIFKHYLAEGGIYFCEDLQDVDNDKEVYLNLDPTKNIEIIDRRYIANRYDDCILKITDK